MLREEILTTIEKNSRVDVHELAVRLGSTDEMIAAEMNVRSNSRQIGFWNGRR